MVQVGSVVGRYRVVRMLASGGMGAVFEGVQVDLPRRVAIKVMHPELGADRVSAERFEREARAAASLGHPNIVQVQDFGRTSEGEPFLVMEYLEGRTLMDVLMAETRISPERVGSIFSQLLTALDATHRVGVVHRDLKASNVFLVPIAGGELVKVLDFGVAKIKESEAHKKLTSTGVIVGTPQYMPPEQMRGEDVDERADIYCTGVMMFMSLAGRRPFEGDGQELTRQVIVVGAPPLARVAPHVPPALGAIVDKSLARDRRERFASAAEMLDALRRSSIPPQPNAPRHAPAATLALPPTAATRGAPGPEDAATHRRPAPVREVAIAPTEPWAAGAIGAMQHPVAIPPTSAPPPARRSMPARPKSLWPLGLVIGAVAISLAIAAIGIYLQRDSVFAPFREQEPPAVDRGAVLPAASSDPPDAVYITTFTSSAFEEFDIESRFDRHGARWLGCFRGVEPRWVEGRRWHPGLWKWTISVDPSGRGRVVSYDPGDDPIPGADGCMRELVEDMEWPRPATTSTMVIGVGATWNE